MLVHVIVLEQDHIWIIGALVVYGAVTLQARGLNFQGG